jgi:hypothetical protein
MVDPADALRDITTRHEERGHLQRDWIVSSAECGRQAKEALTKAAEILTDDIPSRPPETELARAWADVGQGWATLSQAEATRSVAAAAFSTDQKG